MNYNIIEDCSPFYIRFTYEGIEDFIKFAKKSLGDVANNHVGWRSFNMARYNKNISQTILEKTPVSKDLILQQNRVNYFMSGPGLYYKAHKDGFPGDRYSINYPIIVEDDKCITSWYSDEDLAEYKIDNLPSKNSRECAGFNKSKHIPIKTMVAKTGECILFNTEIFHDWDNSRSTNIRVMLTLRNSPPENFYFEDARKALFGY
jgi:hypothetical protein